MFCYSLLPSILQPDVPPRMHHLHAAVAMILDPHKRLLMMQRALHPNDPWSGHMGFPGGVFETVDRSLRDTAQRECKEEIGISLLQDAQYMGALTRMNHPKISVDAFVYTLDREHQLIPNEEVAGLYWLSLDTLRDDQNRSTIQHRFQGEDRVFPAIGIAEVPVPIWGISLGFIDQLFQRWSRS